MPICSSFSQSGNGGASVARKLVPGTVQYVVNEALILEDCGSYCQGCAGNPMEATVSEHCFSKQGVACNQTSYAKARGPKILNDRLNACLQVLPMRSYLAHAVEHVQATRSNETFSIYAEY